MTARFGNGYELDVVMFQEQVFGKDGNKALILRGHDQLDVDTILDELQNGVNHIEIGDRIFEGYSSVASVQNMVGEGLEEFSIVLSTFQK